MSHPRPAPFKLDIIVVGGAVTGLSMALGLALSGHTVRVLEQHKKPGMPVAPAGIRLTPNVTKILVQWGLADELRKKGSLVREESRLWDYETGDTVASGYLESAEPVMEEVGASFYMMRYSDLRDILYDAVVRADVEVIFNTKVSFAKPPCNTEPSDDSSTLPSCDTPTVHLSDGTILEADMIIGADGQHSTVRQSFQVVKPRRTSIIVLSGTVPMGTILEDDVLKKHSIAYSWAYWFGSGRCFMGYPITSNSEYAVHLFWDRKEPEVPEGWIPNVSAKSLKLADTTSDVKLSRMLEKVDSYCWQSYLDWPEIENWSDDSHRIVLIGEASHPLTPCSTQSCSLSIEAAAVLSALLSYVRGLDHIPHLVSAYETIHRERAKFLHKMEVRTVAQSMFPPGPERETRDLEMRELLQASQHRWDDDVLLRIWGRHCQVWAYDAFDAADNWWVEWGVLRERAMCVQDLNAELPWSPLEISVSTRTEYD